MDAGFFLIPKRGELVMVTDASGAALGIVAIVWLFVGSPQQRGAARDAFFWCAMGNFFSISLHTVTILPPSDCALGLMGHDLGFASRFATGGLTDKLMSNHVYNFGLTTRMLVRLSYLRMRTCLALVVLYSVLVISTRAHYTVDVVLAWWALAAVHNLDS